MITITKSGDSAVKFEFTNSQHYLTGNGEIEVPINSLSLVIDDSNMFTFKKIDGDVFVSATYGELGMSKEELEEWYKENMVGETGGGGIDSGTVQSMIDESISGKVDTSTFSGYSASTDARLTEDEEVTAAGLNALNDALSGKQDTLIAGNGIDIDSGNTISVTGGSIDSGAVQTMIDESISGKADVSAVTPTFEVTEAEYNALVTGGTVDPNAYYIITDATPIDLSGYVQTSAITTSITSGSTDSQVPSAKAVYDQLGDINTILSSI